MVLSALYSHTNIATYLVLNFGLYTLLFKVSALLGLINAQQICSNLSLTIHSRTLAYQLIIATSGNSSTKPKTLSNGFDGKRSSFYTTTAKIYGQTDVTPNV